MQPATRPKQITRFGAPLRFPISLMFRASYKRPNSNAPRNEAKYDNCNNRPIRFNASTIRTIAALSAIVVATFRHFETPYGNLNLSRHGAQAPPTKRQDGSPHLSHSPGTPFGISFALRLISAMSAASCTSIRSPVTSAISAIVSPFVKLIICPHWAVKHGAQFRTRYAALGV